MYWLSNHLIFLNTYKPPYWIVFYWTSSMICLKLTPRLFSRCEITSFLLLSYSHSATWECAPREDRDSSTNFPLPGEYPNISTASAPLDILMTVEFLVITPRKTRPLCPLCADRPRGCCVSRTDTVPAEAADILVKEMERQIIKTSNERECFSL